jgi:membrane-bound metal-dependent hydrolase YbcI (DUF457 family)
MFIGHFAVGFAAKTLSPKASLGTYFLAALFLDLLWPALLLLKIEEAVINTTGHPPIVFSHYPISHSLLMAIVWAVIISTIYFLFKRYKKAAIMIGLAVVSHWVLDVIVHQPDLPLVPGVEQKVGLGEWVFRELALFLELVMFFVGIALYMGATRPKNNAGRYGTLGFITFSLLMYLASVFGPPPADMEQVIYGGFLQWIFVIWAYWIDDNRKDKRMNPLPQLTGFTRSNTTYHVHDEQS